MKEFSYNWHTCSALLLIALCTSTLLLQAQRIDSVKSALNDGNLLVAVSLMDNTQNDSLKSLFYEEINREVIAGYTERVMVYMEFQNPNVQNFELQVLTYKDELIFYKLKNKSQVGSSSSQTLNEKHLQKFKQEFKNYSGRDLQWNQLFQHQILYGSTCSMGSLPEYRIKLNALVQKKDTVTLNKWLSSEITELQVYAVDGFFQLKQVGIDPDSDQLKKIRIVKQKNGVIYYCTGCERSVKSIQEITVNFVFDE